MNADAFDSVRAGDEFDWHALERHLRDHLELPDGTMEVFQFTAGRANLTYLVTVGDARLVVRRPPRGHIAPGSHDMGREHRVLSALSPIFPRAPRSLYFCDDSSVIDAPFVVIEYRDGQVITGAVPASMAHHPDVARRVCLALIDAMAELHTVDIEAAGLEDIGNANGFAERQVSGWCDRMRRVASPETESSLEAVADALHRQLPTKQRSAVVHNDLKLDNCQFQPEDPDHVTSVFDWAMATIGDPMFDLGTLIVSSRAQPTWALSRDDVAVRYEQRSGLDLDPLPWYEAFALWRSAVVVLQLHHRFTTGDTTDDRMSSFVAQVPDIAAQSLALLRTHGQTNRARKQ